MYGTGSQRCSCTAKRTCLSGACTARADDWVWQLCRICFPLLRTQARSAVAENTPPCLLASKQALRGRSAALRYKKAYLGGLPLQRHLAWAPPNSRSATFEYTNFLVVRLPSQHSCPAGPCLHCCMHPHCRTTHCCMKTDTALSSPDHWKCLQEMTSGLLHMLTLPTERPCPPLPQSLDNSTVQDHMLGGMVLPVPAQALCAS